MTEGGSTSRPGSRQGDTSMLKISGTNPSAATMSDRVVETWSFVRQQKGESIEEQLESIEDTAPPTKALSNKQYSNSSLAKSKKDRSIVLREYQKSFSVSVRSQSCPPDETPLVDFELSGHSVQKSPMQVSRQFSPLPSLSPTSRVFIAHRIASGHSSSLGFRHPADE
eukprot:CAMPEP_0113675020 /NCGR_PEP_ID=MMETSP0038_2-20120614/7765_1 /TAXON_ID=2898 /ORGANISM="Cryptomonas paramecium" /LENGTH=167 /DNA_ID=CAMNT_0000591711 /DNA_START=107 /DNA_END=607 /DNA_ORIENTATION=+ /assembly_acc=CAM_ASM_000170